MKRIIAFVAAVFMAGTINVYAKTEEATDLTKSNNVTVSDKQNGSVLSDGNYSTKLTLGAGTKVTISNKTAFSGIYVIWDRPVKDWTLTIHGKDYTYGSDGFLHEYINLPYITNEITITVPENKTILCDVYTFSSGITPSWVQKWQPQLKKADMLVLPAHYDDEFIFFGGTIPYYSGQEKLNVQVAYLTTHWGTPHRPHEMLNGLWAAGLQAYPVIGEFPDKYSDSLEQAKKMYDFNKAVDYYVTLIREFKPSVIVTHDLKGEYGHGGHMLASNSVVEALEKANDSTYSPESFQKYGVWNVPKTYLHLYGKNKLSMDWNKPLSAFGGKTAFEMAQYAYSFHKSQQKDYQVAQKPGVYDCRAFGLYRTTVGEDVKKDDFMENIPVSSVNQPIVSTDSSIADSSSDVEKDSSLASDSAVQASQSHVQNNSLYAILSVVVGVLIVSALAILIILKTRKSKSSGTAKKQK